MRRGARQLPCAPTFQCTRAATRSPPRMAKAIRPSRAYLSFGLFIASSHQFGQKHAQPCNGTKAKDHHDPVQQDWCFWLCRGQRFLRHHGRRAVSYTHLDVYKRQIVGVGASTLAIVAGALVAGPITGWIIRRHGLQGNARPEDVTFADPALVKPADPDAGSIERLLSLIHI